MRSDKKMKVLFIVIFIRHITAEMDHRNFKYIKKTLNSTRHLYLQTAVCESHLQLAAGCMSTSDCNLADVDTGDLYAEGDEKDSKYFIFKQYLLAVDRYQKAEDRTDGSGSGEEEEVTQENIVIVNKLISELEILIGPYPISKSQIKITHIPVTCYHVSAIIYHRPNNAIYWCCKRNIYGQLLRGTKSVKLAHYAAVSMEIYKDKFYFVTTEKIYVRSLSLNRNSIVKVFDSSTRYGRLSIDGENMFWTTKDKTLQSTLWMAQLPNGSAEKVPGKTFTHKGAFGVETVGNHRVIIWYNKYDEDNILSVKITRKKLAQPENVKFVKVCFRQHIVNEHIQTMKIQKLWLYFSREDKKYKVEKRKVFLNCSLGEKKLVYEHAKAQANLMYFNIF